MAEILDSVARAFARRDLERVRLGLIQAAAKVGGSKGERIADVLGVGSQAAPEPQTARTLSPLPMASSGATGWRKISPGREPWIPASVAAELARWSEEIAHAEALFAAGERCMPLLLVGETRCGKTSAALSFAHNTGRNLYRLDASAVVESYMGESSKRLKSALDAVMWMGNAVFVIDEVDAVAPRRGGGGEQKADKERDHMVGCLLTWLEELPAHVPLVCTTNRLDAIDSAVASRMTVVEWPGWDDLGDDEREDFLEAHGAPRDAIAASFAQAVALGRRARVERVLKAQLRQNGGG